MKKLLLSCLLISSYFVNVADASTVVGVSAGEFRVDESGAATYNIPISVPSGTTGVTPQISLSYSSNNMFEGPLGVGWSISGLSSIARCPQTPIQDEGNIRNINMDNEDKFCLDGQRLILVSGTYGVAGSTYRTEVGGLSTITAEGGTLDSGPTFFKVSNHKAGETHYYGNITGVMESTPSDVEMDDAFVELGGKPANDKARSWAVKAIVDIKGNYIWFNYDKDIDNGSFYIDSIQYTGNSLLDIAPFAKIDFIYDQAAEPYYKGFKGYMTGGYTVHDRLLTSIVTTVDDDVFRAYDFTYENSSFMEERTLLTSVLECADDVFSNCFSPINFNWQRPQLATDSKRETCLEGPDGEKFCFPQTTTWNYKPFPSSYSHSSNTGMRDTGRMFDINGDGYNDLVYVDNSKWQVRLGPSLNTDEYLSNWATNNDKYYAMSIDSNGNGVRELLVRDNNEWKVVSYEPNLVSYTSCLGGPCRKHTYQSNITTKTLGIPATGYEGNAQVADVNGDGLEDIVFYSASKLLAHINSLNGTWSTNVELYNFNATQSPSPLNNRIETQTASMKSASAVDMNGDGRTDLIFKVTITEGYCTKGFATSSNECRNDLRGEWIQSSVTKDTVFISSGDIGNPFYSVGFEFSNLDTLRAADFNGDKLTDIAYISGTDWMYRLSTGDSFTPARKMGLEADSKNKSFERFIDLNGDGRADVLHATSSSYWHFYFSQPTNSAEWISFENRGSMGYEKGSNIVFGDVSGDGKLEMLTLSKNTMKQHYSRAGIKEFVISDFTNSHGINTHVSYKPMTDEDVYIFQASDNQINSDTFSPISGMQLVSKVETDVNNTHSTTKKVGVKYQYGGLLIHKKGRGSLGFQMLKTTDLQTGVVTETQYNQDYAEESYAFARMPIFTHQSLNGEVLSTASNTLNYKKLSNGSLFPYIEESVEKSYVYGSDSVSTHVSTTTTKNTYDSWGNATNMIVELYDEVNYEFLHTTTNNAYGLSREQKTGRLKSTTVTKKRTNKPSVTRLSAFTYYDDGMLKTTAVKDGDNDVILTTYEYDDFGNKVAVSNKGHVTDTENCLVTRTSHSFFDSSGRFLDYTTNGLGEKTTYKYNNQQASQVSGKITEQSIVSPNGLETRAFFDDFGRKEKIDYPDAKVTNISLIFCDQCDSITNAYYKETTSTSSSPISVNYYDRWGRTLASKVQSFKGGWNISKAEYDEQGRIKYQYEPNSSLYSENFYDVLNRITKVIKPNFSVVELSQRGLETHTINELGQSRYSYKNGFGENHYTIDNIGNEVRFDYDSYGNLLSATTTADGTSTRVSSTFDDLGQKKSTTDPVKGVWTYTYNDFGELYSQTSAEGQHIKFHYDELGRKIRSFEAGEGTLCWIYGSTAQAANKAVGKLIRTEKYDGQNVNCSSGTPTIKKEFTYDSLGRPKNVYTTIDGNIYEHSTQYDSYSRPYISTYPSGTESFSTKNIYNNYGYLYKVVNNIDSSLLQEVISMDERNKVTEVKYGNNVEENKTFYSDTGWFESSSLSKGSNNLQYIGITYDYLGNVESRKSQYGDSYGTGTHFSEIYSYDDLNRLEDRTISVTANVGALPLSFNKTLDYEYDGRGNFKSKTNAGYYKYNTENPYLLEGVYGNSNFTDSKYAFTYDKNGNVIADSQRTFKYTGFNKAYFISSNDGRVSMKYDESRQLYYKESTLVENGKANTYKQTYIGNYEKSVRSGGDGSLTEHKYYVGNILVIQRSNDTKETNYLHKDHQGSVIAITNDSGDVVSQSIYDPFGKKTDVYLETKYSSFAITKPTERGYTGHKHLSHVNIIHMNGRIYDPTLGRFLQADPHIQAPSNSQSYNRYSYVLNNPMSMTDPSGYFFKKLFRSIAKIPILNMAIQAVMAVYCQVCLVAYNAASTYAVTGSLKGALIGAFTSAIMPGGPQNFLIAGMIGGLASKAQGGNFGHGFSSAGLGALLGGQIKTGNAYANVIVSAVIGGTVSKLTGGKFANGAQTWAFSAAMAQDWSSSRGLFSNSADVENGYQQSVKKYGSQDASFKLSDDLSLDYTVSGSDGFADGVAGHISELSKTTTGRQVLTGLAESGNSLSIFENIGQSAATARGITDLTWSGTIIALDPNAVRAPVGLFQNTRGGAATPFVPAQHALAHELVHAWQNTSWSNGAPNITHNVTGGNSPWERQAAAYTNLIREQQGSRYRRVRYE